MSKPSILTSTAQIGKLARTLAEQDAIAIDLEADSLHHYRNRICLMQISTPDETVLIDTLLVDSLDPLRPVLADAGIRKIFHAADFDLRCLRRDFGLQIHGLFDTMIAAQLLGEERIGLADLLQKYFQVELDKRHQKADWSQRPLPIEMIDYAAEDTCHLHRLANLLEPRLIELGRMGWANEEFALAESVAFDETEGPLCLRIKGASKLDRRQLGVLEELLQWREREGRRRDRPVFKVIHNKQLLEVARHTPQTERALETLDGFNERMVKRHSTPILKAVRRGLEIPQNALPTIPRGSRPPKDPQFETNLKALKTWRQNKAESLQLDPGVLINNAALEELAVRRPEFSADLNDVSSLKNWQRKALGEEILRVLANVST